MKKLFCLLQLLISTVLIGQVNLVPNPSFEQYDTCPNNLDQFDFAAYWFDPNSSSPDLFNTCSGYGVPQNAAGWQLARTGSGYAGIGTYSFSPPNSGQEMREYIVTHRPTTSC